MGRASHRLSRTLLLAFAPAWVLLVILVQLTDVDVARPWIHWGGHFAFGPAWTLMAWSLHTGPRFLGQGWIVRAFAWLAVGHVLEGIGTLLAAGDPRSWWHWAPVIAGNAGGLLLFGLAWRERRNAGTGQEAASGPS